MKDAVLRRAIAEMWLDEQEAVAEEKLIDSLAAAIAHLSVAESDEALAWSKASSDEHQHDNAERAYNPRNGEGAWDVYWTSTSAALSNIDAIAASEVTFEAKSRVEDLTAQVEEWRIIKKSRI